MVCIFKFYYLREGSLIACFGSHVKDTVMAYRVPLSTFSTKCRFSDPDVKKDKRPTIYKKRNCLQHNISRILFFWNLDYHLTFWQRRDYPVVCGGGNQSSLGKPTPKTKSQTTSLHAQPGFEPRYVYVFMKKK